LLERDDDHRGMTAPARWSRLFLRAVGAAPASAVALQPGKALVVVGVCACSLELAAATQCSTVHGSLKISHAMREGGRT
jgi:hypothetical protein